MPENDSRNSTFAKLSFLSWPIVLISLVVLAITMLVLYSMGTTKGVEFSPDDFSRRRFSYNQAPLLKWVIHKKVFSDATTPFEYFLTIDGFVPTVVNRTKAWHLIQDSGSHSAFPSDQCDARFLTDYLDLKDDDGIDYWMIWTEDFPKSAKIFWPRVAELARDEMYLRIPDVMQFAMELEKDNPTKFKVSLDQRSSEIYLELGEIDLKLDRIARAKRRLEKSVDFGNADTGEPAASLLADNKSKFDTLPVATNDESSDE